MIVSDTAITNRVSVMVLCLIILVAGAYSYSTLPREDEPDITIPYVFVSTTYKGVSSSDIETSITIPIEKKLRGLKNVKSIRSVSAEGESSINIEFIPKTDIEEVLQKVKDKVDEAKRDLPNDLEDDPSVYEVNLSEMPIVVYSLNGDSGVAALKRIADDLEEDIESIPGVLEVDVTGGSEREIIIEVDPKKLAYYHIPITVFNEVVPSENTNTSGGSISLGDGRYQLRVPGEFKNPDEIYGIVIATFKGQPVYLKDLARIIDGFKDETSRSRLNGRESVNLSVKKRSGENIIRISEEIDKLIHIEKQRWPLGTHVTKMMDKAKNIHLMVMDLENNILSGLVLVVGVLLFAMGFRNAVIVAMAIPFSMLMTFTILQIMGITLNMVVLFSLSLALGMLVDNAIVIVENIYRYMEQGVPRIQASKKATSEVAYPVIGSTLTTLAAFAPMLYWPGIMGEFMSYLPLTLIVTLSSSLFVALVINPALASYFMKLIKKSSNPVTTISADELEKKGEDPIVIQGPILINYAKMINYCLSNRIKVLVMSFLILIAFMQIWMLVIGIEKPVEFFPSVDPKNIYVNIDPPEGADLEYVDSITKQVETAVNNIKDKNLTLDQQYEKAYVQKTHEKRNGETFTGPTDFDNVEHIYATSVEKYGSKLFSNISSNHLGIQFVDFEQRKRPSAMDLMEIRHRVQHIPGARITVMEEEGGPPTGDPINIEIAGDDLRTLGLLSKKIQGIISEIPLIEDVRDDYMDSIPSIQVNIDRQKAALLELSTGAIGFALKTAYNGYNVSTYRENGEDYDITVKLSKNDRKITDVLHNLMIPSPNGQLIPLTTVADIEYSGTIGDINRINHERVVTIKANVDESKTTGSVLRMEAEKLLKDIKLPEGYKATFTGEGEAQEEAQAFLSKAFVIALLLIFLILVTQFNSVIQPLIIMTSVVLSLGGVFLGLAIMRFPFGIIMCGVGVISLAGVVVNNAIVLIDYTNKLRERGMELKQAIVSAGATRLRPVFLTAVTTILGLIPMVTGISINFRDLSISMVSETSQYWKAMSSVVIFGLAIATFLTLLVVPTLYSLSESFADRIRRLFPSQ